MTERIGTKHELRVAVNEARRDGKRVGFVPTMGALHDGHLSLIRAARARVDFVVVSVFVNPTQFGPSEDFERYPRRVDEDLELLAAEGVDVAFVPTPAEMYGDGPVVTVDPGPLAMRWEGQTRPSHFAGMATVVTKLLSVVRPDVAFFGEKDYQQLLIVKRMVKDLDLGCSIVGCPTVREADGLALSSRNVYLAAGERTAALGISAALEAAENALAWGERDASVLEDTMRATVAQIAGEGARIDYAAVVDAQTLEPLERVEGEARALIAVYVGEIHLIDNCPLQPKE